MGVQQSFTVLQVTQQVTEVLAKGAATQRISQQVVEVLAGDPALARISQQVIEVLSTVADPALVRITQTCVEVLTIPPAIRTIAKATNKLLGGGDQE